MASFDPYREWLAVTTGGGQHNYYELLGLRPLESDLGKINTAFRRQSDRLAPHLSGSQAAVAQRLMTELTEARMTLSTPTAKRAYDQSLAAGQPVPLSAAPIAKKPARWSGSPAPENDDALLPPAATPIAPLPNATPVAPMPGYTADAPAASQHQQMPIAQPSPYAATHPMTAMPAATPVYPYPAQAYPASAYAPQAYPQGYPPMAYGAPASYQAAPVAAAPVEPTPQVSTFSGSGYRAARRRRSSSAPLAAGVLLAALVLLGGVYWKVNADRRLAALDKQTRDQPVKRGTTRPAETRVPPPKRNTAPRTAAPRTAPLPKPSVPRASVPPASVPTATPQPPPKTATPEMPAPEPAKTPPPTGDAPPKSMPDAPSKSDDAAPAPNQSAASPEEAAAVSRALRAARLAMAARDLSLAREQLDQATLEATGSDTTDAVARVERLFHHLEGFWEAARGTLAKLQAAEEIEIDGEMASVVDASSDRLTLRVAGQNREYKLATLPPKVAMYLARRWLAPNEPASELALAAFQMVDPKGDRQEARRLLQSAAAGGIDIKPLLAELDAQNE